MNIYYFATFREITRENSCFLSDPPATVGELLDVLSRRYGSTFRNAVYEDGGLSPFLILLVNGRNVRHADGLATPLSAEDVISVFPMVAGG